VRMYSMYAEYYNHLKYP